MYSVLCSGVLHNLVLCTLYSALLYSIIWFGVLYTVLCSGVLYTRVYTVLLVLDDCGREFSVYPLSSTRSPAPRGLNIHFLFAGTYTYILRKELHLVKGTVWIYGTSTNYSGLLYFFIFGTGTMQLLYCAVYTAQSGVQKISKIVINGSILIFRFAVKRLDKNKHLKKNIKKVVKKFRMVC